MSRQSSSVAIRVLSVWKPRAMRSHISRMCSRMSSGRPFSGRGIASGGLAASGGAGLGGLLLGPQRHDPALDLADAGQVFVELRPVAGADPPAQAGGFLADAVKDALVATAATVVEQGVEGQRRIDLHRHRRGGALPGDVRAVGHREVRLVVAGDRLLASEDQARLDRLPRRGAGPASWSTLMPPFSSAPFFKAAPERMLPVWPGWMPTPRACLLNSPLMMLIFALERLQGLQARPQLHRRARALRPPVRRVHAAAHEQRGEPLRSWRGAVAAQDRGPPGGDRLQPRQGHRHARAPEEDPPRRTARDRSRWIVCLMPKCSSSRSLRGVAFDALVPELRAGDDRLDQDAEAAAVRLQRGIAWRRPSHRPKQSRSARVRRPGACGRGSRRTPPGERFPGRPGVPRPRPRLPPPGKSTRVSTGRPPRSTVRVSPTGPYPSNARPIASNRSWQAAQLLSARWRARALAEGLLAELGLVVGQVGDVGRRGRDVLAEQPIDDPVAALDRAGPQTRRVLREEDGHRQEPAAAVASRVVDAGPGISVRRGRACRSGGPGRVDERVPAIEELDDGAVVLDEVEEEPDRLLEHRTPQLVVECGEPAAIDAVVLLEPAEVEPVAAELRGQAPHAVAPGASVGPAREDLGLVQVARGGVRPATPRRACSPRGSSSVGWPGRDPRAAGSPIALARTGRPGRGNGATSGC